MCAANRGRNAFLMGKSQLFPLSSQLVSSFSATSHRGYTLGYDTFLKPHQVASLARNLITYIKFHMGGEAQITIDFSRV